MLSCITVSASNITVTLNGAVLSFDVSPQIISDRTFVPMRKIFESLGATVSWDEETKTITGIKDDTIVNLSIGSDVLIKNGFPKKLDVAPTIVDSRALVPVRAIAESFDCSVEWISESQTIKITASSNASAAKSTLTAAQIYEKISPSVFYIEVCDESSEPVASGSGFFISEDGVAVTNYHVIDDTFSATITTNDNKKYDVISVISYDKDLDVAIIRVSKTADDGSSVYGFPALTLGDSDKIVTGQTIYAIGSPEGFQNTISDGIISSTKRDFYGKSLIQITAPISHGSSGGVLTNEYGEALGITSNGILEAENLGFAIPINVVKPFDLTSEGISYEEFAINNSTFILELDKNAVELDLEESVDIRVYAEGKDDDWSIYWDTDQDDVVSCEWGDWEDDNVCILTLSAVSTGVAKVTVYSDVDFEGKDIVVSVKGWKEGNYPSLYANIPTFTSVTGVELYDIYFSDELEIDESDEFDEFDSFVAYVYEVSDSSLMDKYVKFLENKGFTLYDTAEGEDSSGYCYMSPGGNLVAVAVSPEIDMLFVLVEN